MREIFAGRTSCFHVIGKVQYSDGVSPQTPGRASRDRSETQVCLQGRGERSPEVLHYARVYRPTAASTWARRCPRISGWIPLKCVRAAAITHQFSTLASGCRFSRAAHHTLEKVVDRDGDIT
eukprot:7381458-Prymnesium_polylepis.1